jgi:flagellar motor switch protein FliN/FliY
MSVESADVSAHKDVSANKFCQLWGENVVGILQRAAIADVKASASSLTAETASPQGSTDEIALCFTAGGKLCGEVLCVAKVSSALALAQALSSEPIESAVPFGDQHRAAFTKLFQQAAANTASGWKQLTGTEGALELQTLTEIPFPSSRSCTITITATNLPEIGLTIFLAPEFLLSINDQLVSAGAQSSPTSAQLVNTAGPVAPPGNLDLLMDVELAATIRFGEREMRLREVLALMPGAVIELDQHVNEPADLLVAGRMVARGEVVVVDGNFGLRVTEVASRSQRASLVPLA